MVTVEKRNTSISPSKQLNSEFKRLPETFLKSRPRPYIAVLDAMIWIDNKKIYGDAYISEICRLSGYKRTCVKKYLDILIADGFIGKIGRYFRSSLWRLNPYLHKPSFRTYLSGILRAFTYLPFAFLLSSQREYSNLARPLKENNILYILNIIDSIRNKDSILSTSQPKKPSMNLQSYPNMSKRLMSDNISSPQRVTGYQTPATTTESDNNPWGIQGKRNGRSSGRYHQSDNQPVSGSIRSEETIKRQRLGDEALMKIREQREKAEKEKNALTSEQFKAMLASRGIHI